jgi:WD40 repeat protein
LAVNILGAALLVLGRGASAQSVVVKPTQPELAIQLGHSSDVTAVAFSPDGRYVITGSADGWAVLWAVESGGEIRHFGSTEPGPKDGLDAVAFHPNGNYVLAAGMRGASVMWDALGRKSAGSRGTPHSQLLSGQTASSS